MLASFGMLFSSTTEVFPLGGLSTNPLGLYKEGTEMGRLSDITDGNDVLVPRNKNAEEALVSPAPMSCTSGKIPAVIPVERPGSTQGFQRIPSSLTGAQYEAPSNTVLAVPYTGFQTGSYHVHWC